MRGDGEDGRERGWMRLGMGSDEGNKIKQERNTGRTAMNDEANDGVFRRPGVEAERAIRGDGAVLKQRKELGGHGQCLGG